MEYRHTAVLLKETIEYLDPKPGQNFIDCTLGGGGHALAILERIAPDGKLLAFDLEKQALLAFEEKMEKEGVDPERVAMFRLNFSNIGQIYERNFSQHPISGIIMDLGLSSALIEDSGRGFTFRRDEPLDMRFNVKQKLTASHIINRWPESDLSRIFRKYGEEKHSLSLARRICRARKEERIRTTGQLAKLVRRGSSGRKKDPAARIFQALRIAVNGELEALEKTLPQAAELLETGGRLAVISFHSLEDRIVKRFFSRQSRDCLCPPEFPICQCSHKKSLKILTKKPATATEREVHANSRSKSAKMRVAEKI